MREAYLIPDRRARLVAGLAILETGTENLRQSMYRAGRKGVGECKKVRL